MTAYDGGEGNYLMGARITKKTRPSSAAHPRMRKKAKVG